MEKIIQGVKIYCRDIGMEYSIEKCATLVMKRPITKGIELPNQERIIMFEEKETYKYLGRGHYQISGDERKN